MMDHEQTRELEFRKFEYEFVNQKLNLNVARVDKLWVALGSTVIASFVYVMANPDLDLLYIFVPMIAAVWLTMYLYVLSQMAGQKRIVIAHAREINRLLGTEVLLYDLKVQQRLWRYDRPMPSGYAMLQNAALFLPCVTIFGIGIYNAFGILVTRIGLVWAWVYVLLVCSVMVIGVVSFVWLRISGHRYLGLPIERPGR